VVPAGPFVLALVSLAAAGSAESRGLPFWKALAENCVVPPGESAAALVDEAVGLLGSRSSEWRDDVGYGVVASCVYQKRALSDDERRALVERLSANLLRGIGETGSDSVLLRSFSALDLSILAALENEAPALDAAGYRRLVDAALSYLRDERDLRGIEPGVGWIHATAHTADLVKFLARDSRFAPADVQRLLEAVVVKLITPGARVFTHAEEERLAAAVASVVRRRDFDPDVLDPWLARFVAAEKQVWTEAPPQEPLLDAAQNGRSFLRCLYVVLSLPAVRAPGASVTPPAPAQTIAREKVLAALAAIRR
jgi:hypothetical protein